MADSCLFRASLVDSQSVAADRLQGRGLGIGQLLVLVEHPVAADLDHADPAIRHKAANDVANLGVDAIEAIPTLMAHFHDPDQGVRVMVLNAIGIIGSPARGAVNELRKLLKDPDEEVAQMADFALVQIQGS